MSHGRTDQDIVAHTHNTARFFTEWRHISWVLLAGTVAWGVFGYRNMPQRKDPDIPVRQALALVPWPGASAEKIEQLVTRRVEEKIAENARVDKIESNTRTGLTAVFITLVEGSFDMPKEFDDIKMKLDSIGNLPEGAGPIQFVKDFGDTAALMLTIASPKTGALEIGLRARALREAIETTRRDAADGGGAARVTIAHGLPASIEPDVVRPAVDLFVEAGTAGGVLRDARVLQGPGFVAVDAATDADDRAIERFVQTFLRDRLRASEMHPDAWPAIVVRDPADAEARLTAVAGDKYTYRELDDYTDLITRTLKTLPMVSKVTRHGLLDERVFLEYSQERLASYGVSPGTLRDVLSGRNITATGGVLEVGGKNLTIDPSGEFKSERDIGDVLVPTSNGRSVYLRDLVDVGRGYVSPPSYLNFYGARTAGGEWRRSRAVTLAIQMRAGQKIDEFAKAVDARLAELKSRLPEDLDLARTSDQPRQVAENVSLFMNSLYEAVALVVLVSLIGFWEWRSALLMALSIPITLAMTFGMMYALGIDLQQVSIASLIIALGLLVDDPVVAGDAIKRDLAAGHPPVVAAWLGPTKLATAILFATITNIVAYLPFLILPGDTGTFLYSLPVVIGCSLLASRIVSMTFIPLLSYYLLRPKAEPTIDERRKSGFAAAYYRIGRMAIAHRWAFLAGAMAFLVAGGGIASRLKSQYFPKDLQYLSYVDVWLPEDAPLSATQLATQEAEAIVREVSGDRLRSLTTFVGGGGPRFWMSASPEQSQLNYAQIIMEVKDKHDTNHLVEPLQHALSERIAGARIDVRLLEVGAPVGIPVAIRIAGEDIPTLRALAESVGDILRSVPTASRVRDNWGPESFAVHLKTDPDRANLAGLTNREVAAASATAMNGTSVSTLREGDKQIPIVARMRMEERAALSDIRSLYVYSMKGRQKVPLESVTSVEYGMQTEKLQRRNQFRTVTISAFPADGVLPSEVLNAAMPGLRALERSLPPGYTLEIGGEYGEQVKGFGNLAVVMLISIAMIFVALVVQFRHAIKPLIVFAAIPFGVVGALAALWVMGAPFGFMAFLGVASLIGVIVSHIIVLFDFIEEKHAEGESLEDALLDAGIMRLRPVLITVAATVIALFPLAAHGGPLWEPMCYTQIGGLSVATFVTLLVVPVIYAIFVKDLKLVKWESRKV
ncbi:MAG TPA: efflux RND transporter permease subunit [Vicinamibacterales bacterium]|nr:efflux RND transporter permease subunit [Vicinamibacterales bacterium]